MTDSRTAEENLNLIRSLMERSTLYRTVSVPGAAWGGFLSVGAWLVSRGWDLENPQGRHTFLGLWIVVLALTVAGNLFFLTREARQTGRATFSPGYWTAGRSLFPSFFCAGFFTLALGFFPLGRAAAAAVPFLLALIWILFYGLGLLATQHFAPRSIVVLGGLFLLTPLLWLLIVGSLTVYAPDSWLRAHLPVHPSALMALTFGGYHLGYALIVPLLERKNGPGKEEPPHGL
ncbi:hypothetical protein SAMN05444156_0865 [Verrucomicrobium sp. GAS474]|uniref:hypothetical protein n=1 Tax=Verrucomicrobium sp. GAS474 TaxID=1882831 RepID=UPI00087A5F41|nr:hypothetical protein [Verrucomicrobium sp. GAS474]SDT93377.1 hypothetical protein SAMN05444156_0865 [Verrucomicrobium sp. GAS474]